MRIRELAREEIDLVWSIDRSEEVENVYRLEGAALVLVPERHDVRGWPPGEPEHYAPILLDGLDHGGTAWGAFDGGALVGAAVLERRFIGSEGDTLQLKFLHVGRGQRGTGLGLALFERAVERARALGARRLYVSSTTSENTVRFYLRRGFRPAREVDPDLHALEPEDVHLTLDL
ncbi:MAG TPA: GNAT family N-acetyltransferase [Myxococcota bacterium]|nr:GNAT family N-acetyltransferase [Myxococcota bacterium]